MARAWVIPQFWEDSGESQHRVAIAEMQGFPRPKLQAYSLTTLLAAQLGLDPEFLASCTGDRHWRGTPTSRRCVDEVRSLSYFVGCPESERVHQPDNKLS
ncbi:hypothetical protein P7L53_00895 [Thermoleptolyngbya sichuanensis XZ-Cy5]|uniref:hypothetical protein n=1 Tax=Thermoleptolyngbya sichuanensis TaxID=2885951 RepID=UPI00240D2625|nr:hypothetical protein [Thermoleptolyngbya sichuanensis]MDG2614789.1 hypothetical protein [Thermoleptolyngbya sichuanensis XZ-Cy5]